MNKFRDVTYLTAVTVDATNRALKIRARLKEMAKVPFMQERVQLSQLAKEWPTMTPEEQAKHAPFLAEMEANLSRRQGR